MRYKLPIKNDPSRKGELAAKKKLFNDNRYAVAPVHTRHDKVAWFVWDVEVPDIESERCPIIGHKPAVIRIADSYEEAVEGLLKPTRIEL